MPESLPLLPLTSTVPLPGAVVPLTLARELSSAAVEAAMRNADHAVFVFTQRDPAGSIPWTETLFTLGVRATLENVVHRNKEVDVVLRCGERVQLVSVAGEGDSLCAACEAAPQRCDELDETRALAEALVTLAAEVIPNLDTGRLNALDVPTRICALASAMHVKIDTQQGMLDAPSLRCALEVFFRHLRHERQVLELRRRLETEAHTWVSDREREQVLRQELASIEQQLGEDPGDLAPLQRRLEQVALTEPARAEASLQLRQLQRMAPSASEYQVTRTYLEFLLELPWAASTTDILDIGRARTILDEDHCGLDQVKERILEHLAVMRLNPGAHAPILCFVGPPGTGKTSLGKSIARALGRHFERVSLGGMHDEAELRGHRRTYVGAMTGRVMEALRRAKVKNPLLMLDEVDKLRRSFEGDPAAALLEILDPAQNCEFHDNYVGVPFDLSKVFFITTANTLEPIPAPLLDRMETIRLAGYTLEEKVEIGRRHLVPQQVAEAGLSGQGVNIPDSTVRLLIEAYTREAGVRQLERVIARVCRRLALRLAETDLLTTAEVTTQLALELLGPEEYAPDRLRCGPAAAGVAVGLAYTESGGDVLYVEASRLPEGGDDLLVTGNLGAVMQESARTAWSFLLSHADSLGLGEIAGPVHVHVPAGATPKDGPSAGLAMCCALASALTGKPARPDTAMTGEVTLTGLVLPVGGLKEKVLCAQRNGFRRIVLPAGNQNRRAELQAAAGADVELIWVASVSEAFQVVLGQEA